MLSIILDLRWLKKQKPHYLWVASWNELSNRGDWAVGNTDSLEVTSASIGMPWVKGGGNWGWSALPAGSSGQGLPRPPADHRQCPQKCCFAFWSGPVCKLTDNSRPTSWCNFSGQMKYINQTVKKKKMQLWIQRYVKIFFCTLRFIEEDLPSLLADSPDGRSSQGWATPMPGVGSGANHLGCLLYPAHY